MDWAYKAMLTTITVALVLLSAHALGRRAAGLLAGLPIITAPSLLFIAEEQGTVFAASSAVAAVLSCGLTAVFALAYERLSRRCGPALALAGSLGAGGVLAMPMALLGGSLGASLLASAGLCAVVLKLLPQPRAQGSAAPRRRGEVFLTAVAAGVVSVAVALVAGQFGPYWAGLLASLPVVSAATLVNQHVSAAHADIERFLRGYVCGLIGKGAFALTFALLAGETGALSALLVASAFGAAAILAATQGAKSAVGRIRVLRGI